MASTIDATKPLDNSLITASELRALASAAKMDIEALQASQATGSGTGLNLYLSATSSGIGSYDEMSKIPDSAVEIIESAVVNNNTVLIDAYILNAELSRVALEGGEWVFDFYHYVSAAHDATHITYEMYKRTSGGVETLLFSVNSETITATSVQNYVTKTIQQSFVVASTDKLVLKVYATSSFSGSITVYLVHSGINHYSHIMTPLLYTHNALPSKQGGTANEYYHLTAAQFSAIASGVSGSFTSQDGKAITVTNGIITAIV